MIPAGWMHASSTAGAPPRSQAHEVLLAAALHRMMAHGFSSPDPATIEVVRATARDLTSVAARAKLPFLQAPLRAVLRAWRSTSARELQGKYSRLFLGAGLVPLRESSYGGGDRFAGQPVDIADVNGFYLAFGFELADRSPFPPDHLGTQLEFLSLLLLKRANADRRGAQREARTLDQARRLFLNDHLGRWAGALAEALLEAKAAPPYAALGELLRAAVALQCRELRIKPPACGRSGLTDEIVADRFDCPWASVEQEKSAGRPP